MSWKTVALGDVVEYEKTQGIHTNLPYVGMENIESNTGKIVGDVSINSEVKSLTFRFDDSHVLYGRLRPYLNKVYEPNFVGHCSTEIFPLKPSTLVLRSFLKYWLLSETTVQKINDTCTGARMPRANMNSLLNFEFPLPSLATQQKIVEKLESIFAEIDRATVAIEENVENVEALFQCYLTEVFENGGEGWIATDLGSICELYQPKTITTNDLIDDGKYPVYGANGVIGRYDKFNHEESQLLVTCRGATCGAVNISEPFSWINGNAMVVKPKSNEIYVRFIEFFFRGAVDLTKAITGAAQPQITRQSLSPIKFKYPSSELQRKIVSKLDIAFQAKENVKSSYLKRLSEFKLLKQSILKQAFNGELVKE